MASTYSPNLAIELIGTGDQAGTWGSTTNTNLGTLIEQAVSGYVTQAVATGTDTTITIPNGATGVARNMYIELTGTGGTNTNLIVPANKKIYFIYNNSTGAVTVKVSGQTGVSVAVGQKKILASNGTDVVEATTYLQSGGGSITVTTLTATSATITGLSSTSADITTLTGTTFGTTATTQLRGASAQITALTATSANLTTLNGTSADITTITGTTIGTTASATIRGASGSIAQFTATSATVTTLTGTSSTITTLANTTLNSGSASVTVITGGNLTFTSATVTNLTATSFTVTNTSFTSANITTLTGTTISYGSASITTVTGATIGTTASATIRGVSGSIGQFTATSATITTLSSSNAGFGSASISVASIPQFTATSMTVTTLTGTSATITGLSSTSSNITTLTGTTVSYGSASITTVTGATIGTTASATIRGVSGSIGQFTATSMSVTTLTGTSATITGLTSPSANITTVVGGAGAVGTPSYTFTGDLNTGMWSPGADIVGFSTGGTERARFTLDGYFKASNNGTYTNATGTFHELRKSTAAGTYTLRVDDTNTTAANCFGMQIYFSGATPNGAGNSFLVCADSTALRAYITSNGGLSNYQANDVNLSDQRLKKDVKPVGSYWDKLKAIEIVAFKYKDQTHDDDNIGVIAQQVESVAPEFISNDGFGETPEDGVPFKTVYTTDMYHAAIKALQEAMARIETLEAKVAALEGN